MKKFGTGKMSIKNSCYTIRCGGCGCTVSGEGFASLQERIVRKGWMKDADGRYYCKKCTAFHSAEAS